MRCLFLKHELRITSFLEVVHKFGDLERPKLNKDKTEALWLGKDNYQQTDYCIENTRWPTDPI